MTQWEMFFGSLAVGLLQRRVKKKELFYVSRENNETSKIMRLARNMMRSVQVTLDGWTTDSCTATDATPPTGNYVTKSLKKCPPSICPTVHILIFYPFYTLNLSFLWIRIRKHQKLVS